MQNAAWAATPTITVKIRNEINIPNEIRELVREKRRARARWHRSRNPADRKLYNRLANNLKNKLRAVKQETYQHYLSQLSKTDHTTVLGKSLKRINNHK